MLTKEEIMKRYLRGDYYTLRSLSGDEGLLWEMRELGWGIRHRPHAGIVLFGGCVVKGTHYTCPDGTVAGGWSFEGGKEWWNDLTTSIRRLYSVNAQFNL